NAVESWHVEILPPNLHSPLPTKTESGEPRTENGVLLLFRSRFSVLGSPFSVFRFPFFVLHFTGPPRSAHAAGLPAFARYNRFSPFFRCIRTTGPGDNHPWDAFFPAFRGRAATWASSLSTSLRCSRVSVAPCSGRNPISNPPPPPAAE